MNGEYDFDKFTEDSSDDYPKYDGGVEFYPYAASKKEDVLKENIAIAKDDPERVPKPRTPFSKKVGLFKTYKQTDDDWFYKDVLSLDSDMQSGCDWSEISAHNQKNAKEPKLSEEQHAKLAEDVNRQFNTGAQRDTGCNKLRHSLIPHEALDRVAKRYLDGAEKYGENNWTKGMPLSVYYDSAMRHMQAWWSGDENEDHAAAAVWNMLCAMWTEENASQHLASKGEFLDDRCKYPRGTKIDE